MHDLQQSLEEAIASSLTRWESAMPAEPMAHFTGRDDSWTIQLVCLGSQRMGAATRGLVVLKLTDAQAELAEKHARAYFERQDIIKEILGGQEIP